MAVICVSIILIEMVKTSKMLGSGFVKGRWVARILKQLHILLKDLWT